MNDFLSVGVGSSWKHFSIGFPSSFPSLVLLIISSFCGTSSPLHYSFFGFPCSFFVSSFYFLFCVALFMIFMICLCFSFSFLVFFNLVFIWRSCGFLILLLVFFFLFFYLCVSVFELCVCGAWKRRIGATKKGGERQRWRTTWGATRRGEFLAV